MSGASSRPLAVAAAALSGILVGSAIVATRFAVGQTGPASLAFLRYAIALVCMLPPFLLSARTRIRAPDLPPIAILGMLQFGVLIVLLNFALQYVSAAHASLIFALMPLVALMLAGALGQERFTGAKVAGVTLTVVGVGLTLGLDAISAAGGARSWIGEAAALGSAVCGAVCSVLYRPYLKRYSAVSVSVTATLAAVVFLAVVAGGEGFFAAVPRFTMGGWLAVAFIGINSGVGYFLWLWSLTRVGATRVTVFLALSPLTAGGLGTAILGERTTPTFWLGGACVAGGLWLAHRPAVEPMG